MSDVGTENIDLNVDRGTRSHIESAVAAHTPSPDVTHVVNNAVERNNAVRRARDDGKSEVKSISDLKPQDRLRATIREAVTQARNKAANPAPIVEAEKFIHNGPPGAWDSAAKAEWNNLPEKVRLAALREQNENLRAYGPLVGKYAEIEKAIAPHRETYAPKGISDAAAVNELFGWYRALNSPHKATALAVLMNQTGISLQDVANVVAQAQQYYGQQQQEPPQYQQRPQQQQYQSDPAEIAQVLNDFAKDKPQFEEVRVTMGELMQGGLATDLQTAYDKAIKLHSEEKDGRKRAVSPSSRSPSAALTTTQSGKGIRGAIKSAIQESRGRM